MSSNNNIMSAAEIKLSKLGFFFIRTKYYQNQ